MRFAETAIAGVVIVDIDPHTDERGLFARLQCPNEFAAAGHAFSPVQVSLSRNPHLHTLRGMHYRPEGFAETKLVRVTRGRIHDVALDVRPGSATFGQWTAVELSAENARALLVPEGVAHGFLTLEPDTDIIYQIAPEYRAGPENGVRWNDPAFGIEWPAAPAVIGARDAAYPDFTPDAP